MLSHENLIRATAAFTRVDALYDSDNHVSLLPLGWIAEHVWGVASHCIYGMIMNFPENLETVRENVREIAPQSVLYNARLWDALVGTIQVRMAESSWINRKLYELFFPVGHHLADKKLAGETVSPGLRLRLPLGRLVHLSSPAGSVGLHQSARRLHSRGRAQPGRDALLPRVGYQPEADLRFNGSNRQRYNAQGWRHQVFYCRAAGGGDFRAHGLKTGRSRSAGQPYFRAITRTPTQPTKPLSRRMESAGSAQATPATSTTTATWSFWSG